MNLFQWLTIPTLSLLAALEIRAYLRNHQPIHLLREVVWLLGIAIILFPSSTSKIANLLGIGRGTDLVFYAFMLLTTGTIFYLYGRNYTLRRDFVELARRDALRGPIPGKGLPQDRDPTLAGDGKEGDAP